MELMEFYQFLTWTSCVPGVPVLLRILLSAYLQGVQHGPPHGPHLCLPAGCRAGLQGHHHPAAGGGAAGKTGCAGETRIWWIKGRNVLRVIQPFTEGESCSVENGFLNLRVLKSKDAVKFVWYATRCFHNFIKRSIQRSNGFKPKPNKAKGSSVLFSKVTKVEPHKSNPVHLPQRRRRGCGQQMCLWDLLQFPWPGSQTLSAWMCLRVTSPGLPGSPGLEVSSCPWEGAGAWNEVWQGAGL